MLGTRPAFLSLAELLLPEASRGIAWIVSSYFRSGRGILPDTRGNTPELSAHCTGTKSEANASRANWSNIPNSKLAFSPKSATAELRHSSSIGNRATSSPSASAVASSPFSSVYNSATASGGDHNVRDRHPRDRSFCSYFQPFLPHFFFPNDDLHRAHPHRSKISIIVLVAIVFAGVITVSSLVQRLNAPYLCKKDGISLQCPHVKEPPSLRENPYSVTTSWKPCAERRVGVFSDLPFENSTSGYIFIHAEGGLNQQRIAICNAVAVAKIMNATLILPVLKQDQIWKDQTKFEDIFDVDHFIDYLKDDVTIVRDIPEWFSDKAELFSSIRRTVKNIPKYAPAQFYIDNVLPRVREKKIMALKPFVDRLGYDNVPQEINRLRCRVNYHALKFLPDIENMAELLVSIMRNRTGNYNPFMALHLRFEKDLKNGPDASRMVPIFGHLLFRSERKDAAHLNPVYGGQNRMAPLRNMFPNLVTKEELATKLELDGFRKHVTSLAALDFLVCLKSDVFVMTHGGNFAKLIIGNRRYLGHHLKSIKPDKGLMSKSLGDPYMG
ncbi:protein PECTIC ARABINOGALACTAN SYNTHESIS-RELATED-like [Salvia divinorum]|uniref:O-fucosyltransferase family protein n=1 Tax=Salvia divinorum TaxID=28513 RepID=A0ABD1FP93_SALDI